MKSGPAVVPTHPWSCVSSCGSSPGWLWARWLDSGVSGTEGRPRGWTREAPRNAPQSTSPTRPCRHTRRMIPQTPSQSHIRSFQSNSFHERGANLTAHLWYEILQFNHLKFQISRSAPSIRSGVLQKIQIVLVFNRFKGWPAGFVSSCSDEIIKFKPKDREQKQWPNVSDL